MKYLGVTECKPSDESFKDVKIIFSGLDADFAGDIEDDFAAAGMVRLTPNYVASLSSLFWNYFGSSMGVHFSFRPRTSYMHVTGSVFKCKEPPHGRRRSNFDPSR